MSPARLTSQKIDLNILQNKDVIDFREDEPQSDDISIIILETLRDIEFDEDELDKMEEEFITDDIDIEDIDDIIEDFDEDELDKIGVNH